MLSTEDLALLEAIRETGSLSRAGRIWARRCRPYPMRRGNRRNALMRCCSTVAATVCNWPRRASCWSTKRRGWCRTSRACPEWLRERTGLPDAW